MNKPTKLAMATSQGTMSDAEWEARIDLAAVYRLVAHYGWDDVIYNHSSMRVPGEPRNFLMHMLEIPVRRGNNSHVHFAVLRISHSADLSLLDHPEELGLQGATCIRNFITVQSIIAGGNR